MDIARPSNARRRRIQRALAAGGACVVVGLVTLGVSRLKPAAPAVDRATVWIDSVKRGPMVREVRGLGTLVPEDIRWLPALTDGRVERIVLRPGVTVTATSLILELSNPELEQEQQDAELKFKAAEATLANLRVQLQNDYLTQQAAEASVEGDYRKAQLQLEVNEELERQHILSAVLVKQSRVDAEQLSVRTDLAKKQLASNAELMATHLAMQQSEVDQARALWELKKRQLEALHVRAGFAGVLQLVPVDVGQQVTPGTNLARVADPTQLKAELKIAETQAKDIQIGQAATIDTRNGIVQGRVIRIDPSVQNGTVTVDTSLEGPLPKGARPDLSVDGTVEIERLPDVLYVGRPAFGQEESVVGLFKLQPGGGGATRVQVKLGRSSVNTVEIVSGLAVGDQVVLSDMSAWDAFDRVRLQ